MSYPVVDKLHYSLETAPELTFENPPPVEEEVELFKLKLQNNLLVVEMKEVFSSESDARSVVQPSLRRGNLIPF